MSKVKEAEAPAKVLEYLKNQNRPYSAGDVMSNMHKEFNKACIQRALDQLTSKGKVREKVYGKQKVYVVEQSIFPDVDEGELKKMDQQISNLQSSIQKLQTDNHNLETRLCDLKNSLTLEEASTQLKTLEKECAEMSARLSKIKSGSENVTPEQSEHIHNSYQTSTRHWRKRRRMTMDIVNTILEGYPKSKKEFIEEVGIETDEDYGVSLPSRT